MASQAELLLVASLCFLPVVLYLLFVLQARWRQRRSHHHAGHRLPPGPLGLPVVGQSLALLGAMRGNRGEEWLRRRMRDHGPVSKFSFLGSPMVFVSGAAANKFFFSSPDELTNQRPACHRRIFGEKSMLELTGDAHKRVRGAVAQFLRPEMLREYVGQVDALVARHLRRHWEGQRQVSVLALAKILTFDFMSALIFGIEEGPLRDSMQEDFCDIINGLWSVPLDLPFTTFRRSLRGSKRARSMLAAILREQKAALETGRRSPRDNLIAYMASLVGEDGGESRLLSDEEIIDNAVFVMVAGHDTTSVLMTFMVRHLANDPGTYAQVLSEQEEIARSKQGSEGRDHHHEAAQLTWEDISKMKYTWRVAQEVMRLIPPVFGFFRTATKDTEFQGFTIPKGWKVFLAASMTHMEDKHFKEPLEFDPSRFDNSSAAAAVQPFTYVPFGGGTRICPGSELARIETLVMVHHLVTKFKWKLCFSGKEDIYGWAPLALPYQGLPIHLEKKKMAY